LSTSAGKPISVSLPCDFQQFRQLAEGPASQTIERDVVAVLEPLAALPAPAAGCA
jgi:hypothetical protein